METSTVNGQASRISKTNRNLEIPERPKRRKFSLAEKRRIVAAADACEPGTLGMLLRREGIYSSLLSTWRKQRDRGDFDVATLRKRSSQKSDAQALQRRNAELEVEVEVEVENRKLNRRLQRAELILDIQKKAAGLLGIELKGPGANESD
jgi:transposase